MREQVLMKCGCVAQGVCSSKGGVKFDPPIPSCVIHSCLEPADDAPDLAGRVAQCAYTPNGHAPRPSSLDLAFFEYRGPGSPDASDLCVCGYREVAHGKGNLHVCKQFTPHGPYEFDKYYCGCHGWD